MDDGGRASGVRNGVFLTLDSFTRTEVIFIQMAIFLNFGIKTKYQLAGKSISGKIQHRIYVNTVNYPKFHKIVYPIISQIPSLHKLKLPDVIAKKKSHFIT